MCTALLLWHYSKSSVLDLTEFVESGAELCKTHQADIWALTNMHDLKSLQHSIFDEQLELLVDCVRKVIWCKIIFFLMDDFHLFWRFVKIGLTKPYVDMWRGLLLKWLSIFTFHMDCISTLFVCWASVSGWRGSCSSMQMSFWLIYAPACASCSSAGLDFV